MYNIYNILDSHPYRDLALNGGLFSIGRDNYSDEDEITRTYGGMIMFVTIGEGVAHEQKRQFIMVGGTFATTYHQRVLDIPMKMI